MQYILSHEELQDLHNEIEEKASLPSKKKLQEFCTMVANELPVKSGWMKDKVWKCILTVDYEWYCDDCPAKSVCPYEYKSHSK